MKRDSKQAKLMATLLSAVGGDAHAGVKRHLELPTSIGSGQTDFRGASLAVPNDSIKAPKLDHGNRNDRGTNVTIPYARVTPLTVIDQSKGRMSPGDVLFIRKAPVGFLSSGNANRNRFANGHDVQSSMCDPIGVDGLNRLLVGTLSKVRPWQVGVNLLKIEDTTKEVELHTLSVLREYTLDGVIISNEEPFSYTGGSRDGAIFNVAIKGPVKTNNGYLSYETHSPTELYPRGLDVLAWQGGQRLGSERAGDTWHSFLGANGGAAISGMGGDDRGGDIDFVAAFTNSFTKYPTQMFDRKAKMLDRAYIALRRYNLYDDVIKPRAGYTGKTEENVIKEMNLLGEDGDEMDLDVEKSKEYYFFQYMPCTSRVFQTYLHNKQRGGNPAGVATTTSKTIPAHNSFKKFTGTDIDGFKHTSARIAQTDFDAMRYKDVENCVGAWLVGTITDASSDRAGPFSGGPISTSYRMNVNVGIRWVPRNYTVEVEVGTQAEIAAKVKDAMKAAKDGDFSDYKKRKTGSLERKLRGLQQSHTLARMELHEMPVYVTAAVVPAVVGAGGGPGGGVPAGGGPAGGVPAGGGGAGGGPSGVPDGGVPAGGGGVTPVVPVTGGSGTPVPTNDPIADAFAAYNAFDRKAREDAFVKYNLASIPKPIPRSLARDAGVQEVINMASEELDLAQKYSAALYLNSNPSEAEKGEVATIIGNLELEIRNLKNLLSTSQSLLTDANASAGAVDITTRTSSSSKAPAAAASSSSRPLVPTAAPTGAAARPKRSTAPKPASVTSGIVDSVFSTMFGEVTAPATSAPPATDTSTPPSPTHSAGGGAAGGESGPRVFQRRAR